MSAVLIVGIIAMVIMCGFVFIGGSIGFYILYKYEVFDSLFGDDAVSSVGQTDSASRFRNKPPGSQCRFDQECSSLDCSGDGIFGAGLMDIGEDRCQPP
tara:strand:+ start:447 stop:743 length:297 start_codon:yes stop_codon:yes gene_type:complete